MKYRRFSIFTAVLAATLLASGCAASPTGFKALERPATSADVIPGIEGGVNAEPGLEKVLLVAEANGEQYFLGQSTDKSTVCVSVHPTDGLSDGYTGCSAGGAWSGKILETSGQGPGSTTLVADRFDSADLEAAGWTKIHDNILISG